MFRVCGRDVGRWGILIGMHIRTWKRGLLYPNEGTELSLVPDCGILYGVGCSCLRRRRWPDRLREVYLCAARMWAAAVVITALVGTAQRPYCNRICRVVTHTWTVERMQIQMLCHLHRCNVRHNMRGPCVPMLRRCVAQDQQPTALMPCQALPNNQQSPPWIVGQGQGHGHSVHAFSSTWQGMTRASSGCARKKACRPAYSSRDTSVMSPASGPRPACRAAGISGGSEHACCRQRCGGAWLLPVVP